MCIRLDWELKVGEERIRGGGGGGEGGSEEGGRGRQSERKIESQAAVSG